MKKLFMFIVFALMVFIGQAQTVKGVVLKDGINAGGTNISNAEIKTLDGINTAKTVKEQFDETVKTSSIVDYKTAVYTKAQDDRRYNDLDFIVKQIPGVSYIAKTFGLNGPGSGTQTLSDGALFRAAIYIPNDTTVTSVGFALSTVGSYSPDAGQENTISLMKWDGSNYIEIGTVGNIGDLWSNATQYTTKWVNFTTPINVTKGLYHLAVLYNYLTTQTAAPVLVSGSAWNVYDNLLFGFSNSFRLRSVKYTQTSIPSTDSPSGDFGITSVPFYLLR